MESDILYVNDYLLEYNTVKGTLINFHREETLKNAYCAAVDFLNYAGDDAGIWQREERENCQNFCCNPVNPCSGPAPPNGLP